MDTLENIIAFLEKTTQVLNVYLQQRDEYKKNKCKELGVNLLVIPSMNEYVDVINMREYITEICKNENVLTYLDGYAK